jgi:crotonobetainyl-CoA:carnitine CoA-transferase CaiB-like acyl-CoA transferase
LSTGQGQHIDVSVVECLACHLVQAVPYYSYMGAIKGRRAVRGSGFEELLPARDGYVVPSVQGSQPWSVVADLIGLESLKDERFATGAGRIEHGEELKRLLLKGLARWDRKPLFQASGERRLVFGMAQDAGDLLDCPHLGERKFFVDVDHPVAGATKYPGLGPKISGLDFEILRHAPLLGQHNAEILRDELGYTSKDMTNLRAMAAI